MRVIMRTAESPHEVYNYIRTIINRDEGRIVAVFNDPIQKKFVRIIAEVNDPNGVDDGWNRLMGEPIMPGYYNG